MAKQKTQPKTKEEIAALRIQNARTTLESKFMQDVLGSNQVRSNPFLYGQLGVQGGETTYSEAMGGEEAQKARKNLYDKAKERGDRLGVYGEPAITNYEISTDLIEQIKENEIRIPLGDLEEVVKKLAPKLEFSVPEELRAYIPEKLYQKVQEAALKARVEGKEGKIKPEDVLTEQEYDALKVYELVLSPAYTRGSAFQAAQPGYFADILQNEAVKEISEKYKPKGEKGK